MRSVLRAITLVCCFGTCAIVFAQQSSVVDKSERSEEATLDRLYTEAHRAYKRLRSMRVEYTIKEKQVTDLPSHMHGSAREVFTERSIVFAYEGERRYSKVTSALTNSVANGAIAIYDGNRSYVFANAHVAVTDEKEKPTEGGRMYCSEYLNIPITDRERATFGRKCVYPLSFRPELRSLHRIHPKLEPIDGNPCYVIEYSDTDKLWVDPAKGFSVRKKESYTVAPLKIGGPLQRIKSREYVFADFEEVEQGLFLPRKCISSRFARLSDPPELWNKKGSESELVVSKLAVNKCTDADFQIEIPAGTVVGYKNRALELKGDKTLILKKAAKTIRETRKPAGGFTNRWILALNGAGFVVLCVVLIATARKFYRARKPGEP